MPQVWNSVRKAWEWTRRYSYSDAGKAWIEVIRNREDDAVELKSAFLPETYLGKGTILQRDISQMPVHPDSALMSKFMWDWSPFGAAGGWGNRTGVNTSSYGTQPIHMYVVDSTHPDCTFQVFDTFTSPNTPQTEIDTYLKGSFPFPSWATPATNQDHGCAIYDRGTGLMREVFMMLPSKDASGNDIPGHWTGGGGYSLENPGLYDLAKTNYALQQMRGISNVAGMHNSLGFIGITEALEKKINHALCFTFGTAYMSGGPSWPARAADGKLESYLPGGSKRNTWGSPQVLNSTQILRTPTHGQWGRLPQSVDPMYNPKTKAPYPEFTRVIIEACKKYGLVGTDTNLWCNAFNTEQGRTFAHAYGEDPWANLIPSIYEGGVDVMHFPWDLVEWAELDWGRPALDSNMRPGQRSAYERHALNYNTATTYNNNSFYG